MNQIINVPTANNLGAVSKAVSQPNKWLILSVICLGALMITMDGSIVNIALPTIANAFKRPLNGEIQWTVIIYLIVLASSLLPFGKLADLYGAKRIWTIGIIIFTLGSLACGLSASLGLLIGCRGVQAIGASMMLAPSVGLIASTFSDRERGRALGINSVVVALGVSAGHLVA